MDAPRLQVGIQTRRPQIGWTHGSASCFRVRPEIQQCELPEGRENLGHSEGDRLWFIQENRGDVPVRIRLKALVLAVPIGTQPGQVLNEKPPSRC